MQSLYEEKEEGLIWWHSCRPYLDFLHAFRLRSYFHCLCDNVWKWTPPRGWSMVTDDSPSLALSWARVLRRISAMLYLQLQGWPLTSLFFFDNPCPLSQVDLKSLAELLAVGGSSLKFPLGALITPVLVNLNTRLCQGYGKRSI